MRLRCLHPTCGKELLHLQRSVLPKIGATDQIDRDVVTIVAHQRVTIESNGGKRSKGRDGETHIAQGGVFEIASTDDCKGRQCYFE